MVFHEAPDKKQCNWWCAACGGQSGGGQKGPLYKGVEGAAWEDLYHKVRGDQQGSQRSPPRLGQQGQDLVQGKRCQGERRRVLRSDQRAEDREPGRGSTGSGRETHLQNPPVFAVGCVVHLKCAGWPAGPGDLSPLKTRNALPFWPSFRSEWASLSGRSRRSNSSPSLRLAPSGESESTKVGVCKNHFKHPVDRPQNACCLRHGFTKMCFLTREKCTSQKCIYFRNFEPLIFALCFLPSAARSSKKMDQVARNQGFCDLLVHFEVLGARHFWFRMRHKIAGFCHVLSVSVVPSVSVENAMESNDVLMTCFCGGSRFSWRRSVRSPCAPWRNAPLWIETML